MTDPLPYTHAEWHVKPGREDEFIEAWRGLADVFGALEGSPLWGTPLRSEPAGAGTRVGPLPERDPRSLPGVAHIALRGRAGRGRMRRS